MEQTTVELKEIEKAAFEAALTQFQELQDLQLVCHGGGFAEVTLC